MKWGEEMIILTDAGSQGSLKIEEMRDEREISCTE